MILQCDESYLKLNHLWETLIRHVHGGRRTYGLYCSQPPDGDRDALASLLHHVFYQSNDWPINSVILIWDSRSWHLIQQRSTDRAFNHSPLKVKARLLSSGSLPRSTFYMSWHFVQIQHTLLSKDSTKLLWSIGVNYKKKKKIGETH